MDGKIRLARRIRPVEVKAADMRKVVDLLTEIKEKAITEGFAETFIKGARAIEILLNAVIDSK